MPQTLTLFNKTLTNVVGFAATNNSGTTIIYLDTSDANATAADITAGKTAYINGAKVTGSYSGLPSATGVSF